LLKDKKRIFIYQNQEIITKLEINVINVLEIKDVYIYVITANLCLLLTI